MKSVLGQIFYAALQTGIHLNILLLKNEEKENKIN
jgi:hypothetical protein